jgi:NitT/TauT family transport system substrate-binding protein
LTNWNFRVAPLIAGAITVLAGGCTAGGGPAVTSAVSPEDASITVAAIPTVDLAGLYVAQDQGLFAKHGLRVTIEKIASSKAIISDQLAGKVDISAGAYIGYIAAQAAGARFHILAEASTLRPDTRVLVTAAGSPITSVANLVGKKIGVNGTNSIGTLLISALLSDSGISPKKVDFVTDPAGFPAMPGQLKQGAWDAAFLAEPYVTTAETGYGEQVLADLDQGATLNFPVDGYVATQAWTAGHPKTAAAFVQAIEEGQALAGTSRPAVEQAMAESDNLPLDVTANIALPGFPTGPVDETRMQRTANAMLQFGILGSQYASQVRQGTLIRSMCGPGSLRRRLGYVVPALIRGIDPHPDDRPGRGVAEHLLRRYPPGGGLGRMGVAAAVPGLRPSGPWSTGRGELRQVRDRRGRLVQVPCAQHRADPAVQLVEAQLPLCVMLTEQGDQPFPVGVTRQRPRATPGRQRYRSSGRTTTAVP